MSIGHALHLAECEHEAIVDSNKLKDIIHEDNITYSNRAIVCGDQLEAPPGFVPLDEYPVFSTASGPHIAPIPTGWPSAYYFGDGSGGPYSSIVTLRRAEVGIHYVDENEIPTYNIWQALPGEQHTVPRVEMTALLLVAKNVHHAVVVDFFTDSQLTSNTYHERQHRAKFANTANQWVKLFSL